MVYYWDGRQPLTGSRSGKVRERSGKGQGKVRERSGKGQGKVRERSHPGGRTNEAAGAVPICMFVLFIAIIIYVCV